MTPSAADTNPADLLIIGGGPTGLFAAFYAGLRQMRTTLVDSLEVLGGQLATLYPEKYIYDVPGFRRVLAKDLVRDLVDQAMQYHPTVHLNRQVNELTTLPDHPPEHPVYSVQTSHGQLVARSIVIAAGIGAFHPKTLPLANAEQYHGHGLYYFVDKLEEMRGRRVLIIGGGDSAVDWANTLSGLTASQVLIHRRDAFTAHEEAVAQMRQGPTRLLPFHEIRAIGGSTQVEWATIFDNRTGEEKTLEVNAVLVNIGYRSSLGSIRQWELDLQGNSIKVDSTMRTNRPGIFAAGDVTTYPGKLKLIATGFAEAATAVNFAKAHIDPAARAFPGHSSDAPPPGAA